MVIMHPAIINRRLIQSLERSTGRQAVTTVSGHALLVTAAELHELQKPQAHRCSTNVHQLPSSVGPGPSAA